MHTLSVTDLQLHIIRSALETYLEQEKEYYETNFESFIATIKLKPKEKDYTYNMECFIREGHRIESVKDILRVLPPCNRTHDVET